MNQMIGLMLLSPISQLLALSISHLVTMRAGFAKRLTSSRSDYSQILSLIYWAKLGQTRFGRFKIIPRSNIESDDPQVPRK
jgi:hypothetical protein